MKKKTQYLALIAMALGLASCGSAPQVPTCHMPDPIRIPDQVK